MPNFEPNNEDYENADRAEARGHHTIAWLLRNGEVARQAQLIAFAMKNNIPPNKVMEELIGTAALNCAFIAGQTTLDDPEGLCHDATRRFEQHFRKQLAKYIIGGIFNAS